MIPMPKNLNEASSDEIKRFLDSFDTVLSDCDGVLWFENDVIKNSDLTMNRFRELGKRVFYVTNNSTKTREELVKKCEKLGFKANQGDVISTAYLAAEYLKNLGFNKRVYIIGNEGVVKELDRFNIQHTGVGPEVLNTDLGTWVRTKMTLESDIGAVLVGFDEHFSYPKMVKAASYLNDPNCLFIATNTDERLPITPTLVIPGTGSIVRCVETSAGRDAFVVGKPNSYIREAIVKKQGIDPSRTLMIGDRCNTDILFGKRCGFKTLLVLTGVTTLSEVEEWSKSSDPESQELVPQFYIDKLGDLLPMMS